MRNTEIDSSFLSEFNPAIQETVETLIRHNDETYMEYITRIKTKQIARRVKIADIEDYISKEHSESAQG